MITTVCKTMNNISVLLVAV